MKILVVGLGSMGKRRIRLMKQYDPTFEVVGVDSNQMRRKEINENFAIECYETIEDAVSDYTFDAGFVCTSPLSHSQIILELLSRGIHVFTEINLTSENYTEIRQNAAKNDRIVFLSSTFLYRRDIQYMIARAEGKRVNYQYHSGQYLPDWHPWESYKDFFVADKKTNGCREILAIELPWITKCFGKIKKIVVWKDSMSDLELNYCDNYVLMIEHKNGNKGQIIADVVSRKPRRSLEIYGESLQLFWDGTPDSLREYLPEEKMMRSIATYAQIDKNSDYCDNIIENAYMDEIITFFNEISGRTAQTTVMHDFEENLEILNWIDVIEK